jgi:hypothetical protein
VGFALYLVFLAAAGWALWLVTRLDRLLGLGLAAVFGVLFVHSLLYAGFFEDPLTWGVLGLAAAVLSGSRVGTESPYTVATREAPELLAH